MAYASPQTPQHLSGGQSPAMLAGMQHFQQQQHMQQPMPSPQQQQHPPGPISEQIGVAIPSGVARTDPIDEFKAIIPRLKESVTNLLKVAGLNFSQNAQIDVNQFVGLESNAPRVDRALEEFYSVCDQADLNLRLAYECISQGADSSRNTPLNVPHPMSMGRPTPNPDQSPGQPPQEATQSYSHYLSLIKTQINSARDIHDALLVCSHQLQQQSSQQSSNQ